MSTEPRRERDPYSWRPGRGHAGGAVTGVWFAVLLALLTGVADAIGAGWRLGLVGVVGAELVGTLVVGVAVLTLVGGAVRSSSRALTIGAYAAGALVARLLVARLLGAAVDLAPAPAQQVAVLAALCVLAAVAAALFTTRPRLPRTSGRFAFRAGGRPDAGGVPGPSAAPAPAARYLSGGP
ncbi:hypothetical protein GCM10009868_12770 [Terrabacter aerolatus]|uniref:Uncharacterized protein n=1 Tax=Terrabacter aerolatus TaxID=422442 RepID=A0A512CY33_9MICO|nr:hypothetical protein [Terrabacter aerolatus]GEO29133.1 hypothetical protein TAE01_09430 [Terrabacter aerolatus]